MRSGQLRGLLEADFDLLEPLEAVLDDLDGNLEQQLEGASNTRPGDTRGRDRGK